MIMVLVLVAVPHGMAVTWGKSRPPPSLFCLCSRLPTLDTAFTHQVADMSALNKMTPENLAMTVGVHLLRKSEAVVDGGGGGSGSGTAGTAQAVVQRLERERVVVTDLIRLAPTLFPDPPPPSRDGSLGSGGGGGGGRSRVRSARLQAPPSSLAPIPPMA